MRKRCDEEEVFGVISDFKGDKALGPDGFSMAFFQSCWCILKAEIMAVFQNFHTQAVFEKNLNASFLALIPIRWMLWRSRIFGLLA